MNEHEKPTRERQIELMEGAEERISRHSATWMDRPEFREALHRRDTKEDHQPLRRACGK